MSDLTPQSAPVINPAITPARVVMVGTGLLGGSVGLALRAAGYAGRRVGVGRTQATLDAALARGCVDEVSTDLAAALRAPLHGPAGELDASQPTQLVVLATPLGYFADLLATVADYADSQTTSRRGPALVVTDVGSTKTRVCDDAQRLLPQPGDFVGSHPMAGSERHGPSHASANLFRGHPCIMTPTPRTSAEALAVVTWLWRTLDMRLLTMDAADHDRHVAAISHLPHAAAVALVQLAVEAKALDVASTGFRDTTRIAAGDANVWADIFDANREAVVDALGRYGELLDHLKAVIAHGSREDLLGLLADVQAARRRWDETTGANTGTAPDDTPDAGPMAS